MSTRANIIINKKKGAAAVIGVYVRSDGYPDGLGKTLQKYFTKRKDVEGLIKGGDLYYLLCSGSKKCGFEKRTFKDEGWETEPVYKSDNCLDHITKTRDTDIEFVYHFNNSNEWECFKMDATLSVSIDLAVEKEKEWQREFDKIQKTADSERG